MPIHCYPPPFMYQKLNVIYLDTNQQEEGGWRVEVCGYGAEKLMLMLFSVDLKVSIAFLTSVVPCSPYGEKLILTINYSDVLSEKLTDVGIETVHVSV